MNYGKIENSRLIYAPNTITTNGKRIFNPTEEMLHDLGYKPISTTDYPQDGKRYKQGYEETEDEIKIVWQDNEAEYWQAVDYGEAVNAEIRKEYSESDEFAILRQKDEKPEEYAEYFAYCEKCKAFVKEKVANVGGVNL